MIIFLSVPSFALDFKGFLQKENGKIILKMDKKSPVGKKIEVLSSKNLFKLPSKPIYVQINGELEEGKLKVKTVKPTVYSPINGK